MKSMSGYRWHESPISGWHGNSVWTPVELTPRAAELKQKGVCNQDQTRAVSSSLGLDQEVLQEALLI
eukprot:1147022-Pelagomonas_calceolata.AAC.1